jgi:Tfp pilus assembly PilM family ATPase
MRAAPGRVGVIGIDIGSRYIKLVALGWRRRSWQVNACLMHETGDNPVAALRAALQLLPASLRRKPLRVAIALPTSELLIKTVRLPRGLEHEQIDLALRIECGQAEGSEKLYLDYRLLNSPDQGEGPEQLLAVACRQSLMDSSLAALNAIGIGPALVAADVMLIADVMSSVSDSPDLELFVDVGATGVRLYQMRSGVPGYSRSHVMLNNSSVVSDPDAYLLLLRRAVQQYRMFDMLSKPANLFVYGGGVALSAVRDFLQQSFGLPVQCIAPFSDRRICGRAQFTPPAQLHESAFTLAYMLARQDVLCE